MQNHEKKRRFFFFLKFPNFKVVVFFQGLRRVDKTNQTPQHDISRTHSLTLTFGEGGVFQSFPRGLNILSIYGIIYCNPYISRVGWSSFFIPTGHCSNDFQLGRSRISWGLLGGPLLGGWAPRTWSSSSSDYPNVIGAIKRGHVRKGSHNTMFRGRRLSMVMKTTYPSPGSPSSKQFPSEMHQVFMPLSVWGRVNIRHPAQKFRQISLCGWVSDVYSLWPLQNNGTMWWRMVGNSDAQLIHDSCRGDLKIFF